MATGFLILTLYGICIFLVVGLVVTAAVLYFWGRREEKNQNTEAKEIQADQGPPGAPPANG